MASIALRFLPYIIAALAIIGGYFYVANLQNKVSALTSEVETKNRENTLLKSQVKDLSTARLALEESLREAEAERAKVRQDLQAALRKLRNQKPPVECKAAIDWSVDQKDDLKW